MTSPTLRLAAIALLAGACAAPPCRAESSVTSFASDSLSQSSASISDSITGSSHASSPDNKQAEGDYKVLDVAELADRPGMLRLRLQPVAAAAPAAEDGTIFLTLPRAAAEHGGVAPGTVVTAMRRPYGIAFASGQPHAAFFLALDDAWARDTKAAPLSL
jgi:hypothetical protein